jgi:hypothetical protein
MPKFSGGFMFKIATGLFVATFAMASAADSAGAKQKISYEKAWQICKARLDKEKIPGTTTSNDRYLRGGACMAHLGYRL